MSDIVSGLGNLVASVVEIIKGIFTTILSVFEGAVSAVVGVIKGLFNATEGVIGFLLGNILLVGTVLAVFFGYVLYQQRQGRAPVVVKKTN